MRIGFITPEYPHLKSKHAAGLGTSLGNLVKALGELGHTIHVFIYGQDQDDFFVENNINFHLIGDKSYPFAKWYNYRKYIQNMVQRVIYKENLQLIEVPDWTGISAFMSFTVPTIMRFHGSDRYFCHLEGRKQKWKNRMFEYLAVRGANAYIAPTKFAGQLSKHLFKISDKKSVVTIHHGVDLEHFENFNPELYSTNTILYIGTIIRKKGVLELPEIFKCVKQEVPEAKLVLVGDDAPDISTGSASTWKMIRQRFDKSLLKDVRYLGKVPYQKVQDVIKNAHVCVFPTFAETFGMVTVEAMALKKPVVNSDIGWSNELMEHGQSGFLVSPMSHELFAKQIVELLNKKDLCLRIGEGARHFVEEHFDLNKQTIKNIELYKNLLK